MRNKIKLVITFFILITLPGKSPLIAQDTLRGYVLEERRQSGLDGAHLFWARASGHSGLSGEDGAFALPCPPRPDTLLVSYLGYRTARVAIVRCDTVLRIALQPSASRIPVVEVKADRLVGRETATEQLTPMDIYRNPNARADPLRAIDMLPASTVTDETANVGLRGSPPGATGIFLNGVPLYDAVRLDQLNNLGQFSIINTSLLRELVLFPANPPLSFGQSSSGVLALYTSPRVDLKQNSVSLNLAGLSARVSRPLSERSGLLAYANWGHHAGLRGLNSTAFEDLERFQTLDFGAYFTQKLGRHTSLRIFQLGLTESYRYRLELPSFTGFFDQEKARSVTVANLHYSKGPLRLEWDQGFNYNDAEYAGGSLAHRERSADYYSALRLRYFQQRWNVEGGAALRALQRDAQGQAPLLDYAWSTDAPQVSYDTLARILVPEAYIYGQFRLASRWRIAAGGRLHYANRTSGLRYSAQTSLHFTPAPRHRLTAAAGQYQQYAGLGTDRLGFAWRRSRQLSLDYRWERKRWTLSGALYAKWEHSPSQNWRIRGAEAALTYRSPRLEAGLSLASIHSRQTRPTETPTPYDLGYYLRFFGQYELPALLTVGLTAKHRQGTAYHPVIDAAFDPAAGAYAPLYASTTQRLPDYQVLDLNLSRPFDTGFGALIAYLNIGNLLDRKNVREYRYNQDYREREAAYFGRRVLFFGVVLQWD